MTRSVVTLIVLPFLLGACASKVHRGVVAMKIDDNIAHVGIRSSEVSVGDHVELYGNKCPHYNLKLNPGAGEMKCEKISKGHGVIIEILSEDYSAVKFENGVAFKEGDYIEKHSH